MRLLVVEDEIHLMDIIRRAAEGALQRRCLCRRTGSAGLYRVTAYDAIVLDIMLPGISGLDVLKSMRAARQQDTGTFTDCERQCRGPG